MKGTLRLIASVTVLVFASGLVSAASVYYVDDSADPGGNGSEATPFQTIQQGINAAAAAGDAVIVMPGLYLEHVDFLTKDVAVQSSDPADPSVVAATIIDGTESGTVVTFAGNQTSAAVLEGFTVRNGSWTDQSESHGGGIHIRNASPSILGNVVTLNYTKTDGAGICVLGDSAPLIQGNRFEGNAADGWGGGIFVFGDASDPENILVAAPQILLNRVTGNQSEMDGGGVACFENCDAVLKNNVIDNNLSKWEGGGVFVGYGATATAVNNTVADNEARGTDMSDPSGPVARLGRGGGMACWFSGGMTFDSSIYWGNVAKNNQGPPVAVLGTANLNIVYSDVEGGEPAVYVESAAGATLNWGTGNWNTDPFFAPSDYHLQSLIGRYDPATETWVEDASHSPMIDAGGPSLPYDQEPAPANGRINIGAYGNTAEASMGGTPFDVVLVPDATWMYQNTQTATGDRHRIVLGLEVQNDTNANTAYVSEVTRTVGPGDLTLEAAVGDPLTWYLIGSRHGVGAFGLADIKARVLGDWGGGGSNTMSVKVRKLGDVNDDLNVNIDDLIPVNDTLNGFSVSATQRELNVNGDLAGNINIDDMSIVNDLLNGVTVP